MKLPKLLTIAVVFAAISSHSQTESSAFTNTGRAVATPFATDYHSLGINPANLAMPSAYEGKTFTLGFMEIGASFYSEAFNKPEVRQNIFSEEIETLSQADQIELASQFAEKTGGLFCGGFGALDGLAVRMICPRLSDVPDPGNCCCRKGFCALNVQAICDKKKRFLWTNPSNKGSTHDSTAFACSRIFDLLREKSASLVAEGLHLQGDSAYPLTGFLQVPFESPDLQNDPNGSKDAFNCFHSSNRIYIECAFGELIMRWGVFWRSLRFDLRKCGMTIRAAMLLHNFIIDSRHGAPHDDFDRHCFQDFNIDSNLQSQRRLTRATGESARALVADNNEPRPAGRPSAIEAEERREGERIRNGNVLLLATHNFGRPLHSNMRLNSHGHTCMDC